MRRSVGPGVFVCSVLLLVCAVPSLLCQAQQPAAAPAPAAAPVSYKPLTVDRIYRQPGLSGRLTRGIAWTPDSKQLSFFESKGAGKEAKTELWVMDVANGQRRLLLSADKLESVLPAGAERITQATGLGRHAPAEYQWAPNGSALLFQGPTSLAWRMGKSAHLHKAAQRKYAKASLIGFIPKSWRSPRHIGGRRIPPRLRTCRWTKARWRNIRWWILPRPQAKPKKSAIHQREAATRLCASSLPRWAAAKLTPWTPARTRTFTSRG